MVVSRSGLAAGYPPFMPMYISWTDCFSHLKSQNQLKRGSSLFFRYYTGPQVKHVLVPFLFHFISFVNARYYGAERLQRTPIVIW